MVVLVLVNQLHSLYLMHYNYWVLMYLQTLKVNYTIKQQVILNQKVMM